MTVPARLGLLVLAFALAVQAWAAPPDPAAMDRIADQVAHTRAISDSSDHHVLQISQRVDKDDGSILDSDSTWIQVRYEMGERVIQVLGDDGEVVDTVEPEEDEGERKGLLAPFSREFRDRYRHEGEGYSPDGRWIVTFEPVGEEADDDQAYTGRAFIDTTAWAIARIEAVPNEPPRHVKEVAIEAFFHPRTVPGNRDENPVWLPDRIVSTGRAKVMVMSVHFRSEHVYWFDQTPTVPLDR